MSATRLVLMGGVVVALVLAGLIVVRSTEGGGRPAAATSAPAPTSAPTPEEPAPTTGPASPSSPVTAPDAGALAAGHEVAALNERAREALAQGRATDAAQLLESALLRSPGEPVLTRNLAFAYFQRGQGQLAAFDYDGALGDYALADATWPDEPGYALHRASLLLRFYRLEEAREELQELLERHPEEPEAHLLLGDVLNLQDDLPAALEHYERALELGDERVAGIAARAHERTARQHAVERHYVTETTADFVVRHPPGTSYLRLLDVLGQARVEACNTLDVFPRQRAIVMLYPLEDFRTVTGTHDWVGGLFDRKIRLPVLDVDTDRERIEASFRHEFTHLVVSEIAPRCPAFVNEGLAQFTEFGPGNGMARLVAHLDATGVARASLPSIADLPASFLEDSDRGRVALGYLLSYAFLDHVATQHGRGAPLRWVRELARRPLEEAYEAAMDRTLQREEELFRELVRTAR